MAASGGFIQLSLFEIILGSDEDIPLFSTSLRWPNDAHLFKLIQQTCSARIPDAQPSLQKGGRCALALFDDGDRLLDQPIIFVFIWLLQQFLPWWSIINGDFA